MKKQRVNSPDFSMDLFVKDFIASTLTMTGPEAAAYLLSLSVAWTQNAALPADPERIRRMLNFDPSEWARVWPALEPKWPLTSDGSKRRNGRQLREWEIASARFAGYKIRSAAGNAAQRQERLLNNLEGLLDGPLSESQRESQRDPQKEPQTDPLSPSLSPSPPNTEEVSSSRTTDQPPDERLEMFKEFWTAYPRKEGKGNALQEFEKLKSPAQRRRAVKAVIVFAAAWHGAPLARRRFIPHPATWLHQCRFDDDPAEWKQQAAPDEGKTKHVVPAGSHNYGDVLVGAPGSPERAAAMTAAKQKP